MMTDVPNEVSVIALVEETVKRYGRLDYAFNNASVVEDPAPFADKTSSIFDKILSTKNNKRGFLNLHG